MMILIILALLQLLVASEECSLPEELTGVWDSNREGWNDLSITNTSIHNLQADNKNLEFSCYMHNGTTFIFQSAQQEVAGIHYHFYTCLDIVPSDNPDFIFFHVRTVMDLNHNNDSVVSVLSTENTTYEGICQLNKSEVPVYYNMFLRKGYQENLGNGTCPSTLQAEFSVNFTQEPMYNKCPEGFVINGCDRTHLTFNFTQCSNGSNELATSGTPIYTCLTTVANGNVSYTLVSLEHDVSGGQPNRYEFSCLEQMVMGDGQLKMIKSANICGDTPSVTMMANETLSCRAPTTMSPEQTTVSGTNITTQSSSSSSQGPGTGNGEQGGEGEGEDKGSATTVAIPDVFTLLLSALFCVLAITTQ